MTPMTCTCEHKIDEKDSHKILESILNDGDTEIEDDVASFVHLPSNTSTHVHSHNVFQSQVLNGNNNDINGLDRGLPHEYNQGILNQDRHMKSLLLTTERILNIKVSDSTEYFQDDNKNFDINNICLCRKCITRVVTSINQNMEWMQSQTQLYRDAVEIEKESRRKIEKAMSIGIGIASESISDKLQRLEEESVSLDLQCKEQERELEQINMMLDEQLELAKQLTEQEEQFIHEFHSLEIESKSFQSEHRRLTLQCHAAEKERYYLEHVSLHSAMFQIFVDNQGGSRSFPLINGLRLTYRPKGDVPWDELNLAWSKVVQLILSIASSVGFQSANLRILPLVSCAKIIDVQHTSDSGIEKKVYNLGLDKTSMDRKTHKTENIISGITALHALLFQIMNHLDDCMDLSNVKVYVPYDIHPNTIGRFDLRPNLNSHHRDYEDVKWSGIVHCIASNLKWLSENCMTFRPITSKKKK
jgi:hypothetical protein